MSPDRIRAAIIEADRFLSLATKWQDADAAKIAEWERRSKELPNDFKGWFMGDAHVEHAAMRRASLDLTRALARMRAPQ